MDEIIFKQSGYRPYIIDRAHKLKTYRIRFAVSDPGSPREAPEAVVGQAFIVAADREQAKEKLKDELRVSGFNNCAILKPTREFSLGWLCKLRARILWVKVKVDIAEGRQVWP